MKNGIFTVKIAAISLFSTGFVLAQPAMATEIDSLDGTSESMGQVTSVSQLSDVQPTDWAFQALQSLVERYGCIAGYPDGTYRGDRALTRYEFAAGLNACLDRVNELIAAGLADKVSREDLAVLQRLQEEFAAELATLRGRVDALEARVSELEANQFSTTTKLKGEVLFAQAVAIEEDGQFDDQAVFGYRVRLDFDTSFTGDDRLRTRLEAEEFFGEDFAGDNVGFQAGGDSGGNFAIDDLIYNFPLFSDRVEIVLGAAGMDIDNDYSNSISPLDSSGGGGISEFADPRQYEQAFPGSGAGLGASIAIIDSDSLELSLDLGYVADDPSSPSQGNGLFNGDYAGSAQLTLLSDFIDLGIMYSNSYAGNADSEFDQDIYTLLEGPASANTFGAQGNIKLGDTFEIGGGVAYSHFRQLGGAEDFDAWSYQGTIAVNDLINNGDLLGILVGVPTYTRELAGQTDDASILAELFYRLKLNSNIEVTPSIIVNTDPFNDNDNDATIIGTLRTRFRF